MTVIAYKNGVMAADHFTYFSGSMARTTPKIAELEDSFVGCAGNAYMIEMLVDWLKHQTQCSMSAKYIRQYAIDSEQEFAAIQMFKDEKSVLIWDENMSPLPLSDERFAIGIAHEYVLGTMDSGMTPIHSVIMASRRFRGVDLDGVPQVANANWGDGIVATT